MATYAAANNGYCPVDVLGMCQVNTLPGKKGYVQIAGRTERMLITPNDWVMDITD